MTNKGLLDLLHSAFEQLALQCKKPCKPLEIHGNRRKTMDEKNLILVNPENNLALTDPVYVRNTDTTLEVRTESIKGEIHHSSKNANGSHQSKVIIEGTKSHLHAQDGSVSISMAKGHCSAECTETSRQADGFLVKIFRMIIKMCPKMLRCWVPKGLRASGFDTPTESSSFRFKLSQISHYFKIGSKGNNRERRRHDR